jgi:hypothetical protein
MKERLLSGQFNVALFVQFAKESVDKMVTPKTGGSTTVGKAAKEE